MEGHAAAGIVAFRPEEDLILPLVDAALRQADPVFVFVNGFVDPELLERLQRTPARMMISQHNFGVAEAQNLLALAAILEGRKRLLILDQDSILPDGMIAALDRAMAEARAAGEKPALVGPKIVSPAAFKPPKVFLDHARQPTPSADPVAYAISSGSLIDLDSYRRIGRFRSDFFIDAIDTEWCFRARARGFSCWMARDIAMEHRIGQGVVARSWLGAAFPRQPEFRMYAYVRNQAYCLGLPHVPLHWKVRFGLHLARLCAALSFDSETKYHVLSLYQRALGDAFAGRLGPPPGAEGTVQGQAREKEWK